jgi:hypothetical protein
LLQTANGYCSKSIAAGQKVTTKQNKTKPHHAELHATTQIHILPHTSMPQHKT